VSIGNKAFSGEAAVIDINTWMGDGSQIGHSSSLQEGQEIPAGAHYHGSPSQETTVDYDTAPKLEMTFTRKALYSALQLALAFLIGVPLIGFMIFALAPQIFGQNATLWTAAAAMPTISWTLVVYAIVASLILFIAGIFLGLVMIALLPRIANRFLEPDRVYPLYGIHYMIKNFVSGVSNSQYYNVLFGDSSFIVYYLQHIGMDLSTIVQTGSNFGTNQKHDNPFLCKIGTGTMVSDGLSLINDEMSSTSFRLKRVVVGDNNFFGNNVHYPAGGRTGDCLLYTSPSPRD